MTDQPAEAKSEDPAAYVTWMVADSLERAQTYNHPAGQVLHVARRDGNEEDPWTVVEGQYRTNDDGERHHWHAVVRYGKAPAFPNADPAAFGPDDTKASPA